MGFPDNVSTLLRAIDPTSATDINNIIQYQTYLQNGDFSGALQFLKTMANGVQMNINASRFNQILDEITDIEDFLLNNITPYIQQQINQYSDIAVYSQSVDYNAGNIVSYNGSLFFCKVANGVSSTIYVPETTTNWESYWQYFVRNDYQLSSTQPSGLNDGDIWLEEIT